VGTDASLDVDADGPRTDPAQTRPEVQHGAGRSFSLWLVALISAGSLTAYYCLWLARLPQMDFQVCRMGGARVIGGGLYSSHITVLGRPLLFTYPPVSALLFWPFSLVSPHLGQIIWDVVDVVALAALMAVSLAAAHS